MSCAAKAWGEDIRSSSSVSSSSCLPSSSFINIRNSVSETSAQRAISVRIATKAASVVTCDFFREYGLENFSLFLLVFDAHCECWKL
jgi:hypothetical protein